MKNTLIVLLVLTGCASTTVLPREDGTYSLVANSHSANSAIAAAQEDAEDYCQRLGGLHAVVVKYDSHYKGADKNAKAVIGAVGMILGSYHGDGSRMDDNQVEMTFKCKR